jgi:steroid 5-alpha reductase family enzyme
MTLAGFAIVFVSVSAALFFVMAGAFLIWRRTRNSGWIDTVWTFGLGLVGGLGAIAPAIVFGLLTTREVLVALLVVLWSLRLGVHIARRTTGITDDPRYAALVKAWGSDAPRQMFWLAQKQALVSIPLALSIVLAAFNPLPHLRIQDWLGFLVLLIGIGGEAIADRQLRAFRADPANRNRVCSTGLWRYSRHPNYFFEWVGWFAYPLIAIDMSGLYPWGFLALAGPLCMYWLLVHVSGIPPLESYMLERRGDEFRAYQARTSAFFPAPMRGA